LPHPMAVQNEIYRVVNERQMRAGAGGTGWAAATLTGSGQGGGQGQVAGRRDGGWGHGEPAAGPAVPAPSVVEQLTQLDDLRRRGVISRREFAAKKAELLSRM
ncbi:MAG: SHOCT domain-containing protein, partial [Acidimicrobiales bacterium]